jgi:hypothetical protein
MQTGDCIDQVERCSTPVECVLCTPYVGRDMEEDLPILESGLP